MDSVRRTRKSKNWCFCSHSTSTVNLIESESISNDIRWSHSTLKYLSNDPFLYFNILLPCLSALPFHYSLCFWSSWLDNVLSLDPFYLLLDLIRCAYTKHYIFSKKNVYSFINIYVFADLYLNIDKNSECWINNFPTNQFKSLTHLNGLVRS